MPTVRRLLPLLPVLALMVLSGCRTYGGYGSEAAMYNQLEQGTQQYEDALERARADAEQLQAAADTNDALAPLAERLQNAIATHEERLAHHEEKVRDLSADAGYRDLHVAYGALTTDMRMTRTHYTRIVQKVAATVSGEPVDESVRLQSTYYTAPVDYAQLENRRPLTMRQALQGG